jgi:DNA primase
MPSHDSTLQEIKDRIDIVDLISEYVSLKKAGQNWKGLCPFHTEKTPSFTVSPAKQIFHCFGCGTGGDIFTFIVRYENLTFPETLKILANKAGVTLKTSGRPVQTGEKDKLISIHKDTLNFFQQNLKKHSGAQSYLNKRGISRDIQEIFSLGYAPKSWNALLTHLMRKKYNPEHIKKAGLAVQGSKGIYDTFRDRIIFPIYDLKGDVVAFGGRSIDGSEPKYLNSPETPIFNKRKVLYGLNRAKDSIKHDGYAMFMEGYTDVITAHVYGFTNAVAPLGTAFTQEHGRLIKRFTEDVVLVFDSDRAGIKAAKNAASILFDAGLNVKILSFPNNDDPDSFLKKNGKDAFSKLLEHPLSIVDFIAGQGGEKHLIADEIFEIISNIPNEILQDEYIITLSDKLNVNEQRVRDRFKKIRNRGFKKPQQKTQTRPRPGRRPLDELYIIKLLLQLPERADHMLKILSEDDFRDAALRTLLKKIKEVPTDLDGLLSKCEGEEKSIVTELSLLDDFEDTDKVFTDCIKRLKDNRRKELSQELNVRIKEAEKKKDFDLVKKLQKEHQKLLKSNQD